MFTELNRDEARVVLSLVYTDRQRLEGHAAHPGKGSGSSSTLWPPLTGGLVCTDRAPVVHEHTCVCIFVHV
jgi:hypothetical protein